MNDYSEWYNYSYRNCDKETFGAIIENYASNIKLNFLEISRHITVHLRLVVRFRAIKLQI